MTQNTISSTPDRMHLISIAKYCMDRSLWSTRDWALSLIDQPGTIDRYYIDTQIVRNMFTVGTNLSHWHDLECNVTTFMGMKA